MQVQERPRPDRGLASTRPFGLAAAIAGFLGTEIPIPIECYDGSRLGPPAGNTRIVVRSPKALRYVLTGLGELGFARAYVAGEIDVEGDIFEALTLRDNLPDVKVTPANGSRWPARPGSTACGRCRRPRRRSASTVAGTARSATRPRSRTTTTSPTTSTGIILGPLDDVLVRGVRAARTRRSRPRRRPSTSW